MASYPSAEPAMMRYPSEQLSAERAPSDHLSQPSAAILEPRHSLTKFKTVILIGGPKQGTRFRPLSKPNSPKALFPVAGAPMVYHQMEAAASVPGMQEIILLGTFSDEKKQLREFTQQATHSLRLPVRYLEESESQPMGTAGCLYQYRDVIMRNDPDAFFVIHSDVCADVPLQEMIDFHSCVGNGSHMSIMSVKAKANQAHNYGCLVGDELGLVMHYVEKPKTFVSNDISCGVYLLSPQLFDDMRDVHLAHLDDPANESLAISLENDIITPLIGSGRIFVYRSTAFWSQIKTAASTIYANRHYLGVLRQKTPALLADGSAFVTVGDVRVDGTAEIDPTAKIGPNVSIGPRVRVGPGARIKDAIILDNVTIGAHSCILNTIIDRDSSVGAWSRVEGAPVEVNPNDPTTDVPSKPLFNSDGRLEPSVTIVGEEVTIAKEIMVFNSIVLPHKTLTHSYKHEIIL